MYKHPIQYVRFMGILDGISLITLVFIAMPLKYWADFGVAVAINGAVHGGIFLVYFATIIYAQLRVRWAVYWTLLALLAAFIPFANFFLDFQLKKLPAKYPPQPIKKVWLVYFALIVALISLYNIQL
ncbi:MAG: DUF3817 domain-containing protein [Solibacillus sp.]